MRLGALVQARMSSTRCPGKMLRDIAGRPLLWHLLHRLGRVRGLDAVAVATSREASDDALARFCAEQGVPCFRGELEDVAGRLRAAAAWAGLDAFVRICGDSPALDPAVAEAVVALFRRERPHLATNCMPRTFPPGQSVEVLDADVFARACDCFESDAQREHVTAYFYAYAERFAIRNLSASADYSGVRLVVDTEADLERMRLLLNAADPEHIPGLDELAARCRALAGTGAGEVA